MSGVAGASSSRWVTDPHVSPQHRLLHPPRDMRGDLWWAVVWRTVALSNAPGLCLLHALAPRAGTNATMRVSPDTAATPGLKGTSGREAPPQEDRGAAARPCVRGQLQAAGVALRVSAGLSRVGASAGQLTGLWAACPVALQRVSPARVHVGMRVSPKAQARAGPLSLLLVRGDGSGDAAWHRGRFSVAAFGRAACQGQASVSLGDSVTEPGALRSPTPSAPRARWTQLSPLPGTRPLSDTFGGGGSPGDRGPNPSVSLPKPPVSPARLPQGVSSRCLPHVVTQARPRPAVSTCPRRLSPPPVPSSSSQDPVTSPPQLGRP